MGKDLQGKELGSGFGQREDGLFFYRYTDKDSKRKTIYGKTFKETKIKYNEMMYYKQQDFSGNMCVKDWTQKFLEIYKTELRDTTKLRQKRLADKMIYPYLGDRELIDLKNIDIMEWVVFLKNTYKSSTINKAISFLKEMLHYAVLNQLIDRNPCTMIKHLDVEEKKYKAFTKRDQTDFEEYMSGRFYHPLIIIALNTGIRVGEMGGLQISDIDMEKKVININKTLVYEKFIDDEKKLYRLTPPKTRCSARSIQMNKRCYEAMKLQFKRREAILEKNRFEISEEFKQFLFLSPEGHPVYAGYINTVLNSAIAEINKCRKIDDYIGKVSFHLLRHTFATRGFEAGISIKTMQKLLGHSSINMTMDVYTHVFDDVIQEEIGKLDDFLEENKLPETSYFNDKTINLDDKVVSCRAY